MELQDPPEYRMGLGWVIRRSKKASQSVPLVIDPLPVFHSSFDLAEKKPNLDFLSLRSSRRIGTLPGAPRQGSFDGKASRPEEPPHHASDPLLPNSGISSSLTTIGAAAASLPPQPQIATPLSTKPTPPITTITITTTVAAGLPSAIGTPAATTPAITIPGAPAAVTAATASGWAAAPAPPAVSFSIPPSPPPPTVGAGAAPPGRVSSPGPSEPAGRVPAPRAAPPEGRAARTTPSLSLSLIDSFAIPEAAGSPRRPAGGLVADQTEVRAALRVVWDRCLLLPPQEPVLDPACAPSAPSPPPGEGGASDGDPSPAPAVAGMFRGLPPSGSRAGREEAVPSGPVPRPTLARPPCPLEADGDGPLFIDSLLEVLRKRGVLPPDAVRPQPPPRPAAMSPQEYARLLAAVTQPPAPAPASPLRSPVRPADLLSPEPLPMAPPARSRRPTPATGRGPSAPPAPPTGRPAHPIACLAPPQLGRLGDCNGAAPRCRGRAGAGTPLAPPPGQRPQQQQQPGRGAPAAHPGPRGAPTRPRALLRLAAPSPAPAAPAPPASRRRPD
ncbi:hypothetical protein PAPYR_9615 [Paratrimastix pyriformis]|uniref:Uncharacterized protein n=1 Tax=Paratrimastix pyriformis TaxID=342808 RepID=A0ABQ8UAT2_9EUKA|nr:hypothetical protein PAPYR_9615 [Paratrimastix pyriformis]